jgi:hypothetical protein
MARSARIKEVFDVSGGTILSGFELAILNRACRAGGQDRAAAWPREHGLNSGARRLAATQQPTGLPRRCPLHGHAADGQRVQNNVINGVVEE